MSISLFRQQAIDEQKDRLYGEVVISLPLPFHVVTFGILCVSIFITLLLVFGSYARRETVEGYLVPDKGLVKIYATLQGALSKQHIEENQFVKKGALLFTISTLRASEQGDDRDTLLLNELIQQKADLHIKITQEKAIYIMELETKRGQIKGMERELLNLKASIKIQKKQMLISSIKIEKLKSLLAGGYISENKLQEIEQVYFNMEVSMQLKLRQIIQLENQKVGYNQELKQAPLEWKSHLVDLNRSLSEIEQRLVEIVGRRAYSIRAPVSGHLTALQISEGQSLSTQSPLVAILPEGTQLHAEIFLPTRAAGFVAKNQAVFLRYGAFPYQHYGLHKGQVKNIDKVILTPRELPIPVVLNEPVYRVKVQLDQQSVKAYGKNFPLQAGMLLDADIILEERSLGQWLLEPIYGLRGKL